MPHDYALFNDLADAWLELQHCHINFEGLDPKAPGFGEKLEELRVALAEYQQVIERIERQ
jgi:hypothetical protein